ncbi:MAG: DUF4491 family protein [Rikenellaceae bacterium]
MDFAIFEGVGIGAAAFLCIGLFHPIVVWAEYYLTARCWWIFLLVGIAGITASLAVENIFWSAILAVFGFSALWSIKEVIEQEKRVEKGWFPRNPNRNKR